jgi:hypothetical protein
LLPAKPGEDSLLESSLRWILAVIGAAQPRRHDNSLTRPPYFDDSPSN